MPRCVVGQPQLAKGDPFSELLCPLCCGMVLRACEPRFLRAVKRFMHDHGDGAAGEEPDEFLELETEPGT
jgi:hypothetical protein